MLIQFVTPLFLLHFFFFFLSFFPFFSSHRQDAFVKAHAVRLLAACVLAALLHAGAFLWLCGQRGRHFAGRRRWWALACGVQLAFSAAPVALSDRGSTYARHGVFNVLCWCCIWSAAVLGGLALRRFATSARRWQWLGGLGVVLLLVAVVQLNHARAAWPQGLYGRRLSFAWPGCSLDAAGVWPVQDLVPAMVADMR